MIKQTVRYNSKVLLCIVLLGVIAIKSFSQNAKLSKGKIISTGKIPGFESDTLIVLYSDSMLISERTGGFTYHYNDSIIMDEKVVWCYMFYDLRSGLSQHYLFFSDTAKPVCTYRNINGDESNLLIHFKADEYPFDYAPMSDTIVDSIRYNRVRGYYSNDTLDWEFIHYLRSDTVLKDFPESGINQMFFPNTRMERREMRILRPTLEEFQPFIWKIERPYLSEAEKNIFKAWRRNINQAKPEDIGTICNDLDYLPASILNNPEKLKKLMPYIEYLK